MKPFLLVSLTILVLITTSCQTKNPTPINPKNTPNIVLLLADDLGHHELGSYGQKIIQTPELDKLAKLSMKFTNFYAGNSVCSPSRAVLLTGRQAGHVPIRGNAGYFGDDKWEGVALDKDEFTLGEMMKGADYQTAFVGKWHLDKPDEVETSRTETTGFRYGGRVQDYKSMEKFKWDGNKFLQR